MEGKKETTHQPRHSWEDSIKVNFRRNSCHDVDSRQLIDERIQSLDICKVVLTLRFP
jgi:hypothetical protein